jgi:glycosyltransferase involved in cell wall biosynthesis
MACGTPVLAIPGGSVPEIVQPGVSGYICRSVVEIAKRARDLNLRPGTVRKHVEENFSTSRMAGGYLQVYKTALEGIMSARSHEKLTFV